MNHPIGGSEMQGFFRNLPHKQRIGALKRQDSRALPDPGKESFAPGAHLDGSGGRPSPVFGLTSASFRLLLATGLGSL